MASAVPTIAVAQTVDLTNDVFGATVNLPNATFPDTAVDEVILNNTDIAGDFILGTAGDPLSYTIDNGGGTGLIIENGSSISGDIVNNGHISGSANGVDIDSSTIDGWFINLGTISGDTGEGVYVFSAGDFNGFSNNGLIESNENSGVQIEVSNNFTGGFVNTGTITNSDIVLDGDNFGVSISVGGDFSGGFVNSGLIASFSTAAAIVVDGNFSGGFHNSGTLVSVTWEGVLISTGGDFSGGFTNTGVIDASSSEEGVVMFIGGSFHGGFTNSGLITADDSGVIIFVNDDFNDGFTNTGTIEATESAGVEISVGGHFAGGFVNSGLIESEETAVDITTDGDFSGGFHNSGTINSLSEIGLDISAGGGFDGGFLNTGLIVSSATAVVIDSVGSFTGGVTNSGTIKSLDEYGFFVYTETDFTGGVTNTGLIDSVYTAAYISATGNLSHGFTNTGTIASFDYDGVYLEAETGDVSGGFTNTGTIEGGETGVYIYAGTDVLGGFTNSGTITGITEYGVYIEADMDFAGGFTNSGVIEGDDTAVTISTGGNIGGGFINDGTIDSRSDIGFLAEFGGDFTEGFKNTGMIEAQDTVVYITGSGGFSGGFTNTGSIRSRAEYGPYIDVGADYDGGFTNTGHIEAVYTGAAILAGGNINGGFTNSGTIESRNSSYGVYLSAGGDFTGGFTNSGLIDSFQIIGVNITTDGDLVGGFTNTGTINSALGDAVDIETGGPGDVFLHTSGVIDGGETGIILDTVGDASLEIAGLVSGDNGTAVDLIDVNLGGTDAIRVELQPGFDFVGIVDARNAKVPTGNHLVFGGPEGEATFDLTTLSDDDGIDEPGEIFFGFEPDLLKEDDSNFILTNTNPIPFDTAEVTGGVLALDDGANLVMAGPSPLTIGVGGGLGAIGDATVTGDVFNQGSILLSNNGFTPIAGLDGADDTLTITGDYDAGSDLYIDTFLNDGNPEITDKLIVGGDTSGTTFVTVNNTGGPGGFTGNGPTDGIQIVEVGGNSAGDFVLSNDVIAGLVEYDLSQADGQNWYLQSVDFVDQAYVYESLPGALQTIGLSLAGQLVERVGVRSAVPSSVTDAAGNPLAGGGPVTSGLWVRGVGQWLNTDGSDESTTGASFDQTTGFVQGGGEVVVSQGPSGRFLVGAMGHWGTSSVDVDGSFGGQRGSADVDFYGGGLTATWYGASGLYVDALVQYTSYDIDISTTSRFSNTSTDGDALTVSGEAGYRIPVSANVAVVPQGQLIWQSIDFDDFVDPDGIAVTLQDGDSLVGRLGLAAEGSWAAGSSLFTGYAEANVLHEFQGDNLVIAAGTPLSQDLGGTSVEFGLGGTVNFNENISLYAEVDYTIPFDDGVEGLQAVAGLRWSFGEAPPPPPPPAPVVEEVPTSAFIVFFDWDRADLTPEANLVLDDVVVVANEAGYASIRLDGYTDLSGSAQYNLGLSERRANSVANGLIARGIAPDEIVIRAFGEENPLVPTPDGVREPQNRRVEIFLS
ncbi:MAG: autotransporter outer membrane beta-barrel domain-containing protein [Pseudomonadota bacterium]